MRIRKILGMMVAAALAIAFAGSPECAHARKIKTKHSLAKKRADKERNELEGNAVLTLTRDSSLFIERIKPAIRFYGFDKTVSSNLESFFVSNGLDTALEGMTIEVTYFDMKGRQLHKRQVELDDRIPERETLRIDVKSWDTQKSFYFHQSAKPKRQATPFDAKIELISVALPHHPTSDL